MYGQFKICRKNGRYAKSSLPGSIYVTINLPLMNIKLMNIIDTEQFSKLFFRKNHSIARKKFGDLEPYFSFQKTRLTPDLTLFYHSPVHCLFSK